MDDQQRLATTLDLAAAFVEAARVGGGERAIPSCPDWTMKQLGEHVAMEYTGWYYSNLTLAPGHPDPIKAMAAALPPMPDDFEELLDYIWDCRLEGRPWRTLRAQVLLRDSTCHVCGQDIDLTLSGLEDMGPTVDHLVPIAAGGTNDLRNLAAAHRACNARKGDRPSWACDYPDARGGCSHPSHNSLYWH